MLAQMRGGRNKTFLYIIMGLLAVGLVGFGTGGVNNYFVQSVGKVGDTDVPADSYARAVNQRMSLFSNQIGRNLTPQEIESFGLAQNALEQVLSETALDNEAARLGLSVGDMTVADTIRSTPGFQGLDGNFDKGRYELLLERNGISPKEQEETTRRSAARSLIEESVVAGVTGTGDQLGAYLLAFERETRNFEWAALDASALTAPIKTPSEADLTAQYEGNAATYTAPETRKITYVHLSPEMLEAEVEVSEEDLKLAYDEQTERFNRPARLDIDRLVYRNAADAQDARTRLDGGAINFDALVAERGLTADDIAIADARAEDLSPEAAELLFAQNEAGIYGPVKTDLGSALFRVNAIFAASQTSFEDAKAELTKELSADEAARMVNDFVPDMDDLLASGATLEELETETKAERGTLDFVAGYREGIAAYDIFRNAALDAKTGDFPELIDLPDGGVFALRLDALVEPTLKPFEEVREEVIADWTAAETLRTLEALGNESLIALENGAAFDSVSLTSEPIEDAGRRSFFEQFPESLIEAVFTIEEPGKAVQVSDADKVYLARLSQVNAFDPEAEDETGVLTQVSAQISNSHATDILRLFAAQLQTDAGVTLDQASINAINNQVLGINPAQ